MNSSLKKRHLCKSDRCLKSKTPQKTEVVSQIPNDVT